MLQNYLYLLADPFIIAIFIVAGLFILAAILKKIREIRVNKAIEKMPVVKVDAPDEKDEEAYQVLNQVRTDIWLEWNALKKRSEKDNETEIYSTGLFFSYVMRVSEAIAAIYYPEIKNPHYLARIEDLTTLNNRIFTRVITMLCSSRGNTAP